MMGVPSLISWPIAATGIQSKVAPLELAAGGQLVLDNVRQERKDEWRTRAGFDRDVANDLPSGNVPVICTEAPWGGLVGLTRETTALTSGRVFNSTVAPRWSVPPAQRFNAGSDLQLCSQVNPGLWSREAVGPVSGAHLTAAAVAEGGGYRLTAWWCLAPVAGIQVSLTSTDGASISYFQQFNQTTTHRRPRCVYSSVANMLVLFWVDATLNRVYAFRWSTLTGLPVGLGATTVMATNANGTDPFMDALWYGGNTITVVYRDNVATGGTRQLEYNPVTDVTTTSTPGINCSNCLSLFPDPDGGAIRYIGVCTNTPEVRVVRTNSAGAIQTNHIVEAVQAVNIAGVAYNAGTEWMIAYSGLSGVFLHACKRIAGVTSAVYDYGITGYGMLSSNAWREPGTDAMYFILHSDGRGAGDVQPTYLEMALPWNDLAGAFNSWSEPQSKLVPLNAAGDFIETAAITQVQRTGTDRFVTALGRITKINSSADGLAQRSAAVDAWAVQYLNSTTYTGQNQGQGTLTQSDAFLPVGNLLHTATGTRLCTLGSSSIPYLPVLTPSVGAGTMLLKTYRYKTTVTLTDEAGNEWQSPASNVASRTLTGTDNTITVDAYCTPFENATRMRTVKFWKTDGNGSTYKLLHVVTDTIANTLHITYVDTSGDVINGEPFTAEAQAGIVPAMNHIALWNDRLWGADRDYPTRLRFTKPLDTGLLPQFVLDPATGLEFVIDLDDQFGPITGLASLDDKLVVTKERAVYIVSGDGPDNVGNGAFPVANRISSETGHIPGAPLVSTGREVYIVSLGGIYRVGGSQEIDFVGAAIDKYLSMPLLSSPETVIGMVVSPGKNEVRIQTTGHRFVHDRIFNLWIRDTGGMVSGAGIVMTKMLGGTQQCMFTAGGQFWIEAADSVTPDDAGNPYAGTIRHAWVRPSGIDGWIQFFRGRVLGECTVAGTSQSPTLTVFRDDDDSLYEVFQPLGSLTDEAGPIRAEAQVRHTRVTSFSMQLTLPQGDASVRLDAWSAAVHVIPTMKPIGRVRKWRQLSSAPGLSAPLSGMLFWFKSDVGVTMDGSNRASDWADQSGNGYDIGLNGADVVAHGPLWTPGVLPSGLAALDWGQNIANSAATYKFMFRTLLTPDPPALKTVGARTVLAIIKPDQWFSDPTRIGGNVVNFWGAAYTYVNEMFVVGGAQHAADDGGYFWQLNPLTDYKNVPIVVAWEWNGAGSATMAVYVNGVLKPGFYPGGNIIRTPNGGVLRLAIGYEYGSSYTSNVFSGKIAEVIGYSGVNPLRTSAAIAYLMARAGL